MAGPTPTTLPFLPTDDQALLLRACFCPPHEAPGAWRAWRARVELDQIDAASQRLLPILAHSLRAAGVEASALAPYADQRRRAWMAQQAMFRKAARAIGALTAAGVPTLMLKGAALAVTHYDEPAMRPMGDVDMLVRPTDATRAFGVLRDIGFSVCGPGSVPTRPGTLAIRHAEAIDDGSVGGAIDLHWRTHYAYVDDAAANAVWDRARPIRIAGAATLAPDPADLLIGVCLHGARWSAPPAIRWMADSLVLLRGACVDWAHLLAQTGRLRAALPMMATLGFLKDAFDAPVPAGVIAALAAARPRGGERRLFAAEQRPPGELDLPTSLQLHLRLAALTARDGADFARYAAALKGRRSGPEVIRWLYRGLVRR
jgi:hypothetical protein